MREPRGQGGGRSGRSSRRWSGRGVEGGRAERVAGGRAGLRGVQARLVEGAADGVGRAEQPGGELGLVGGDGGVGGGGGVGGAGGGGGVVGRGRARPRGDPKRFT